MLHSTFFVQCLIKQVCYKCMKPAVSLFHKRKMWQAECVCVAFKIHWNTTVDNKVFYDQCLGIPLHQTHWPAAESLSRQKACISYMPSFQLHSFQLRCERRWCLTLFTRPSLKVNKPTGHQKLKNISQNPSWCARVVRYFLTQSEDEEDFGQAVFLCRFYLKLQLSD